MEISSSSSTINFWVNWGQSELIGPAKPTPIRTELLSDIDDQGGLRFQQLYIFIYKRGHGLCNEDPVKVLKEALPETLVYYYQLAGRLREGYNGKLMVDCHGQGVMFVEAEADIVFEEIGDSVNLLPFPYIEAEADIP